eukprot:scaffold57506_cov62-Phaeocystis_antarctica.AAC.15
MAQMYLQPYVAEAATVRGGGCNRMWRRLQPYMPEVRAMAQMYSAASPSTTDSATPSPCRPSSEQVPCPCPLGSSHGRVPCDWPVGVAVSAGEVKVALERQAKGPPSASAHLVRVGVRVRVKVRVRVRVGVGVSRGLGSARWRVEVSVVGGDHGEIDDEGDRERESRLYGVVPYRVVDGARRGASHLGRYGREISWDREIDRWASRATRLARYTVPRCWVYPSSVAPCARARGRADLAREHQTRVEVEVMRHDHSTDGADRGRDRVARQRRLDL